MTQIPTSTALSDEQRRLVQTLGFNVSRNGKGHPNDQVLYSGDTPRQKVLQDNHLTSFYNLAKIGGDPNQVDAEDIYALTQNPKALSAYLRAEPEIDEIFDGAVLEDGKREVYADPGHGNHRDGIPQVAYKRLTALLQMSLNHQLNTKLPITGTFGRQTGQAINTWLNKIGANTNMNKPAIAGPLVFGSLLVRNGLDCDDVAANATVFKNHIHDLLSKNKDFFRQNLAGVEKHHSLNPGAVIALVWALQYLYPKDMFPGINPATLGDGMPSPADGRLLEAAKKVIEENFGAVTIGPKTAQAILDKVTVACPTPDTNSLVNGDSNR